ncbi:MAG: YlbF family regulator [Oscillospiraceae bacterium]|nr:YlbF family regulator [Oscillospiraceae bacterium]
MNVIDKARELGKMIQADERYAAYCKAKDANDKDEALQQMINEFNMKRVELNAEMSKDNRSAERLTALDTEIKDLYGAIMSNENMAAYNEAKDAMDDMLNRINMVITYSANGEDPETCPTEPEHSCSGSCSSCGGCH